jgi:hypothetical protein
MNTIAFLRNIKLSRKLQTIVLGSIAALLLSSVANAQLPCYASLCSNYPNNTCNAAGTCKGSAGTTCTTSNGLGNAPTVWYLNGSYWTTINTNGGSCNGFATALGPVNENYKVLADGEGCWNPDSTNPLGPVLESKSFGASNGNPYWIYTWGFDYACN